MIKLFLFLLFLSTSVLAHQVQLIGQYLKINRQNETAWQYDALGRAVVSRKFDFGLQGTYLERFGLYEKRGGALFTYRPKDNMVFEARYLHGEDGVQILPHDQYYFSAYNAWAPGVSSFLIYRTTLYSVTHLQTINLGFELEKFRNLIIVPQIMGGQARFNDPIESKDVYSMGLRLIYYREGTYSTEIYGYKGEEAAQGIVGESNITVKTTTFGGGVSYYFVPYVKTQLLVDYSDYKEIKNQFLTTTLNLVWSFL